MQEKLRYEVRCKWEYRSGTVGGETEKATLLWTGIKEYNKITTL